MSGYAVAQAMRSSFHHFGKPYDPAEPMRLLEAQR